jgi:hypothetical protein
VGDQPPRVIITRAMVEIVEIPDSDVESILDTESIEHTAEWLDSPSCTIGSLEPFRLDDSFDVLDQSFMDETEDDPCPFDSPKVSQTQKSPRSPSHLSQ